MKLKRLALTLTSLALTVTMAACAPSAVKTDSSGGDNKGKTTNLSLVGFAVIEASHKELQKAWAAKKPDNKVSWSNSFGASGDQARAVASGLEADLVHFSLESDVTRLVDEGLIAEDWKDNDFGGVISSSVVVITVREGNPKKITSWADLAKPGVEIVTPNPGSSGSARWNILAAWGDAVLNGADDAAATSYLEKVFANIVSLPGSGRDATTAFTSGTGDVLISYENEAILAREKGELIDYFIPENTLRIENPGAVLKDADPLAKEYLDFITSDEGQSVFAASGYRPVSGKEIEGLEVPGANDPKNPFPAATGKLLTINDDFGGWSEANKKFFSDDGIITKIQTQAGK